MEQPEIPDQVIPDDAHEGLKKMFSELEDNVVIEVFTKDGENDPFNEITKKFVSEIAYLSKKLKATFHEVGDKQAKKRGVELSPTVLIQPDKYQIRYTGAPIGEEGKSFLASLIITSKNNAELGEDAKKALSALKEKRHIRVFVTPGCPYCPMQVLTAFKFAVENPDLISAECVESTQFQSLAREWNVGSVPHTVINDEIMSPGVKPEPFFAIEVLTLKPVITEQPAQEAAGGGKPEFDVDVVIIGGGPAGLTAGIYAQRAGMKTIILEKDIIGGQVNLTPAVENYPAFTNIAGKKLMEIMGEHAKGYVPILEGEEAVEVKVGKHIEVITHNKKFNALSIILATGATHKKLGIKGEEELNGRGVSYCATCDGYFFKDKEVVLVGGGNSALTDALYLTSLGANVTIIHRRDEFRAQEHLVNSVMIEEIPIIWDTVVEEILGKDKVAFVKLRNVKTNKTKKKKVDGIFITIGWIPHTGLAKDIGVQIEEDGFISVDRSLHTNIPRIYAAGDVTGGVRQIVTAIGEGATAAQTAFEDMKKPYWEKPDERKC